MTIHSYYVLLLLLELATKRGGSSSLLLLPRSSSSRRFHPLMEGLVCGVSVFAVCAPPSSSPRFFFVVFPHDYGCHSFYFCTGDTPRGSDMVDGKQRAESPPPILAARGDAAVTTPWRRRPLPHWVPRPAISAKGPDVRTAFRNGSAAS